MYKYSLNNQVLFFNQMTKIKVDVKILGSNKQEAVLLLTVEILQKSTVKQLLQIIKQENSSTFFVFKQDQKTKALNSSPIKECITQSNEVYVEPRETSIDIVEIKSGKIEEIMVDNYLIDLSTTVKKMVEDLQKQIKIPFIILSKDKKNQANYGLPVSAIVLDSKIYIRSQRTKLQLHTFIEKDTFLLKTVEENQNVSVADFKDNLSKNYDLDVIIFDKSKKQKASLTLKIKDVIDNNKIYVKTSNIEVVVFCEKNVKLPIYKISAKLGEKLQDVRKKNKNIANIKIIDKQNSILEDEIKIEDGALFKNGKYYLYYKQESDQAKKEQRITKMTETLQRLEKVNDNVKDLMKKGKDLGNAQVKQSTDRLESLMNKLKENVTFIKQKDLGLTQKITHKQNAESQTFIQRLYKESADYKTHHLLQQSESRIFWPFYNKKPFAIRKRIIDFEKSKVETTNIATYSQHQFTTREQLTVQKIEKSVKENLDSISTSAKVGVKTPWVSASIQATYSNLKENRDQKQTSSLESSTKQYTIFNALKNTQAYHIDEQNVVLKPEIKQVVKKLYQMLEQKSPKFDQKAKQFFQNYGTHLQIAKYTFGCRYAFKSMAQSLQQTTAQTMASVSRSVRNMGLTASAQGGGLCVSASGGVSVQKTDSSTDSNLSSNQHEKVNYNFEIKYNLQGLELKNRDKWRQLSGIYKKGWKCMGYQDLRLVRMVDILKNKQNSVHNPSYKLSYEQFLMQMSSVEKKLEQKGLIDMKADGTVALNIEEDEILQKNVFDQLVKKIYSYTEEKVGTILNPNRFQSQVKSLLTSKEEIQEFSYSNIEYNIKIYKNIKFSATVGRKTLQIKIQIKK